MVMKRDQAISLAIALILTHLGVTETRLEFRAKQIPIRDAARKKKGHLSSGELGMMGAEAAPLLLSPTPPSQQKT